MAKEGRYTKVTRNGASCIFDEDGLIDEIELFLEAEEPGDKMTLEIVSMTKDEYSSLPEFTGW
jgi:hypothetical protein